MPVFGASAKLNLKKLFPPAVCTLLVKEKEDADVTMTNVKEAINVTNGIVMPLKAAFVDRLGKNEKAIGRFFDEFGSEILDPEGDSMNIVSHGFTAWIEFMPEILIRVGALYTNDAAGFATFELAAAALREATNTVSKLIQEDDGTTNVRDNELKGNDALRAAIETLQTTMDVVYALPVFKDFVESAGKVCGPGSLNHVRFNTHLAPLFPACAPENPDMDIIDPAKIFVPRTQSMFSNEAHVLIPPSAPIMIATSALILSKLVECCIKTVKAVPKLEADVLAEEEETPVAAMVDSDDDEEEETPVDNKKKDEGELSDLGEVGDDDDDDDDDEPKPPTSVGKGELDTVVKPKSEPESEPESKPMVTDDDDDDDDEPNPPTSVGKGKLDTVVKPKSKSKSVPESNPVATDAEDADDDDDSDQDEDEDDRQPVSGSEKEAPDSSSDSDPESEEESCGDDDDDETDVPSSQQVELYKPDVAGAMARATSTVSSIQRNFVLDNSAIVDMLKAGGDSDSDSDDDGEGSSSTTAIMNAFETNGSESAIAESVDTIFPDHSFGEELEQFVDKVIKKKMASLLQTALTATAKLKSASASGGGGGGVSDAQAVLMHDLRASMDAQLETLSNVDNTDEFEAAEKLLLAIDNLIEAVQSTSSGAGAGAGAATPSLVRDLTEEEEDMPGRDIVKVLIKTAKSIALHSAVDASMTVEDVEGWTTQFMSAASGAFSKAVATIIAEFAKRKGWKKDGPAVSLVTHIANHTPSDDYEKMYENATKGMDEDGKEDFGGEVAVCIKRVVRMLQGAQTLFETLVGSISSPSSAKASNGTGAPSVGTVVEKLNAAGEAVSVLTLADAEIQSKKIQWSALHQGGVMAPEDDPTRLFRATLLSDVTVAILASGHSSSLPAARPKSRSKPTGSKPAGSKPKAAETTTTTAKPSKAKAKAKPSSGKKKLRGAAKRSTIGRNEDGQDLIGIMSCMIEGGAVTLNRTRNITASRKAYVTNTGTEDYEDAVKCLGFDEMRKAVIHNQTTTAQLLVSNSEEEGGMRLTAMMKLISYMVEVIETNGKERAAIRAFITGSEKTAEERVATLLAVMKPPDLVMTDGEYMQALFLAFVSWKGNAKASRAIDHDKDQLYAETAYRSSTVLAPILNLVMSALIRFLVVDMKIFGSSASVCETAHQQTLLVAVMKYWTKTALRTYAAIGREAEKVEKMPLVSCALKCFGGVTPEAMIDSVEAASNTAPTKLNVNIFESLVKHLGACLGLFVGTDGLQIGCPLRTILARLISPHKTNKNLHNSRNSRKGETKESPTSAMDFLAMKAGLLAKKDKNAKKEFTNKELIGMEHNAGDVFFFLSRLFEKGWFVAPPSEDIVSALITKKEHMPLILEKVLSTSPSRASLLPEAGDIKDFLKCGVRVNEAGDDGDDEEEVPAPKKKTTTTKKSTKKRQNDGDDGDDAPAPPSKKRVKTTAVAPAAKEKKAKAKAKAKVKPTHEQMDASTEKLTALTAAGEKKKKKKKATADEKKATTNGKKRPDGPKAEEKKKKKKRVRTE